MIALQGASGYRANTALEDPDGLSLDVGTCVRRKTIARRIADRHVSADRILNGLVGAHEFQEAKPVLGRWIDENVHIGFALRIVAAIRAEQVKRSDPAPS